MTGPADQDGFSARVRIEIIAGGDPGTLDILVFRAANSPRPAREPVSLSALAEILEAALAIIRRQQGQAAP